MKKILFPTEFSAHAGETFLYALNLAKQSEATITLLHVYHVPLDPEMSLMVLQNRVLKSLQNFAESIIPAEYSSVAIECIAEVGTPAATILKVAKEEDIDFIVMSMKGKTNALEAYFGSVSLAVVSQTEVPVFLVSSTNRFKPIQKIAFAMELNIKDLVCLEDIHLHLGKLKVPITCVHFNEEEEGAPQVKKTIDFLADLFHHHPKYWGVSFSSNTGKFEEGIKDYVVKNNIDLLITQSHTRNWKFRFVEPSSSNRIARRINIPMLILK